MTPAWLAVSLAGGAGASAPVANVECDTSPWVVQAVLDLSPAPLPPDQSWRLAEIYRPVVDPHHRTLTPMPLSARVGTSICPGDVVETWQRARTVVAMRPRSGVATSAALASVVGEGGSVLEFRGDIVQRRGTATYLLPDTMPSPVSVLAAMSDGTWLKVDQTHSTFQMDMGGGCSPDVQVTVSDREDPWDHVADREHSVRLTVIDARGLPLGEPETVRPGQVGEVTAGARAVTVSVDAASVEEAARRLEGCSVAARAPLEGRDTPPTPVEWPASLAVSSGGPTGRTWAPHAPPLPGPPIVFIELSGGAFLQGSAEGAGHRDEQPRHPVNLSAFYLSQSEVSQEQWAAVVEAARARQDPDAERLSLSPSYFKGPKLPVESVSWCDAVRFANVLSRLEGLVPAYAVGADCERGGPVTWDRESDGIRLPTEAEWEFGARAGSSTSYWFGDDSEPICTYANVADRSAGLTHPSWTVASCDDGYESTSPVCALQRDPWDFCDLYGNVWEWTWDRSGPYGLRAETNPAGPEVGSLRVLRGGSWGATADWARTANRSAEDPGRKVLNLGLRLARSAGAAPPPAEPTPDPPG